MAVWKEAQVPQLRSFNDRGKLVASDFAHVLCIASALSVSQFVPLDIQGYFQSIPTGGASPLPLGECLQDDVVIPDEDLPDSGSCSD